MPLHWFALAATGAVLAALGPAMTLAASCGDNGVCHCEEGYCTTDASCFCPEGMDKHELPNTGPNGGDVCFACRPGGVILNSDEAVDDFDDDDDDEGIFGDDDGMDLDDLFDEIDGNPASQRGRLKCGAPGVCDCEEFRCTVESACLCPLGMAKMELPNTGNVGGDFCYACRPEEPAAAAAAADGSGGDNDDGDDGKAAADAPAGGKPGATGAEADDFDEDDFDEDDEDEDIFAAGEADSEDAAGEAGTAGDDDDDFGSADADEASTHRSTLQCGAPGVCDCEENRCTVESQCLCPLGMVKLEVPNTGSIGGEFCYACRTPGAIAPAKVTEEAFAIPPGVALALLAGLGYLFVLGVRKLKEDEGPKQRLSKEQRKHLQKQAKKDSKKKKKTR